jgi:hypothetical protein
VIQDYIPAYSVQGFLVVGEPLGGIVLAKTGDIRDTFKLDGQIVRDADVRITTGSQEIRLLLNPNTGSYDAPDATPRVQAETTYNLSIRLRTGESFIATTRTPKQIRWVQPPRPILQYPLDTARLPSTADTLQVTWEKVGDLTEYIIGIRCLDTANYGLHFPLIGRPADTTQKNRRIERFFESQLPRFPEVTRYGLRVGTSSAIVWTGFKWFGKQEIVIYAADPNWLNWFKMVNFAGNPRYNPLLGSVKGDGVFGVFGAASAARQRVFLIKNQP